MKANIKTLAIIVFVYLIASCSESDQILPQLDDEGFKKRQASGEIRAIYDRCLAKD